MANKQGNRLTGQSKSDAARLGRGMDAFSAKITASEKDIQTRIEQIAQRNQVNGQSGSAARLSNPLHTAHYTVNGVKVA